MRYDDGDFFPFVGMFDVGNHQLKNKWYGQCGFLLFFSAKYITSHFYLSVSFSVFWFNVCNAGGLRLMENEIETQFVGLCVDFVMFHMDRTHICCTFSLCQEMETKLIHTIRCVCIHVYINTLTHRLPTKPNRMLL